MVVVTAYLFNSGVVVGVVVVFGIDAMKVFGCSAGPVVSC